MDVLGDVSEHASTDKKTSASRLQLDCSGQNGGTGDMRSDAARHTLIGNESWMCEGVCAETGNVPQRRKLGKGGLVSRNLGERKHIGQCLL